MVACSVIFNHKTALNEETSHGFPKAGALRPKVTDIVASPLNLYFKKSQGKLPFREDVFKTLASLHTLTSLSFLMHENQSGSLIGEACVHLTRILLRIQMRRHARPDPVTPGSLPEICVRLRLKITVPDNLLNVSSSLHSRTPLEHPTYT